MSNLHQLSAIAAGTTVGGLGVSIAAWTLVPLTVFGLALGLGLLVERLFRTRLPTAVLLPVGLCTLVVLVMPGYRLGAGAWLAVPLTLVCAFAGLLAEGRGLRARIREDRYATGAAAAVYALYIAPVVLAGGWTWTGYNFVNDTAVQLLLADHLFHAGASMPPAGSQSTALDHVHMYLETAYPLGIHGVLATLSGIVRLRLETIYQPLISTFAAGAAMALAWLLRGALGRRGWAAGVAALALAANLTVNYALQGNAKEIAVLAALTAAAAAGRYAVTAAKPVSAIMVTALPLAAALALFASAAIPYIGCFAIALLLASLLQEGSTLRGALVRSTLAGGVVLVVAALPSLLTLTRSASALQGAFTSSKAIPELGQLVRPLPLDEAAGTWLTEDYRVAVEGHLHDANAALIVLTFVLAVAGAAWMLRRRESGPLLLVATMLTSLLIIRPRVSPYAEAKMIALLGPSLVACAGVGVYRLARMWRPAGYSIAALGAVGILASNALSYHAVRLAPVDRMEAMRDIGQRFAGAHGLLLVDDMDEFAKYFMQPVHMNVALENVTPIQLLNKLLTSSMPRNADLDQFPLHDVETFPLIAQRRGPDASRAPSNYRLEYQNRYFNVWRRVAPARNVLAHISLQGTWEASAPAPCDVITNLKRDAGAHATLIASEAPREVELDVANAAHPAGWKPSAEWPRALEPHTPGRTEGFATFLAGTYEIWVNGSTGRRLTISLDGRPVGSVLGVNTNGESLPGGVVHVGAGRHRIAITRPSGNLAPGDGYKGVIGPVVFEALPDTPELVSTRNPHALCGKKLDWVEAVRAPRK